MEEIGLSLSRAIVEALSHADPSAFAFLTVAIIVQITVILFLVFVAPIWIIRHYSARRDETAILGGEQKLILEELDRAAERIDKRMASIESILDVESPKWKERM